MVKTEAPALLRRELAARQWQPQPLAMSGVTDCYQPIERQLRLTRGCLEVLAECRNPVGIVTKNLLVTRDAGIFYEQLHQLFEVACRKAGLPGDQRELATEHFRRPAGPQLELRL